MSSPEFVSTAFTTVGVSSEDGFSNLTKTLIGLMLFGSRGTGLLMKSSLRKTFCGLLETIMTARA